MTQAYVCNVSETEDVLDLPSLDSNPPVPSQAPVGNGSTGRRLEGLNASLATYANELDTFASEVETEGEDATDVRNHAQGLRNLASNSGSDDVLPLPSTFE